nr:MAG TPA: hypothetical protein [Caudoviricetes sp.]
MENKSVNSKMVIGVLAVIGIIVFFIWFLVMCNTPEYKYGKDAVEDAKAAIFTADQYLDRKLTDREFDIQIKFCSKDVEVSDKTYEIYSNIDFISNAVSDANILKYRNQLANIIGEKER